MGSFLRVRGDIDISAGYNFRKGWEVKERDDDEARDRRNDVDAGVGYYYQIAVLMKLRKLLAKS